MKLIFLDIDGVLVNGNSIRLFSGRHTVADPVAVAALNRLIAETGANIVVSSMWRVGESIEGLRGKLKEWGVVGNVLDKTPVMWQYSRGDEIRTWLQDYESQNPGLVSGVVIIDDDTDMVDMMPYLCKTTFWEGFTESHVNEAKQILENGKKIWLRSIQLSISE